jgi:outer membrane protein OmpA-like peptidoglycan-associated protein
MRYYPKLLILFLTLLFVYAVPALAQTDVPRKTVAVTYPLGESVDLYFRGTTRFPRLRGQARVERKNKTGTKVNITLENLPRPYELGGAYTTYILWAITPEGRADNLGELKFRSGTIFQNPRGEFTTPLQTFALIVTAEPHYLVKEPSRAVILENIQPSGSVANIVNVSYFGNSSDYFRDPRTPEIAETDYIRTPVSLLGARQAVNMAKYVGAERDASVEFEYAQKSLEQAEKAWREGATESDQIDILARQAIAAGVKAEETAGIHKTAREARNERARNDEEIRRSEDRIADVNRERDELKAELERERRGRELAQRDTSNAGQQLTELRQENQRLRDELAKLRAESENSKIQLARADAERQASETQRAIEQRASRLRINTPLLIQSLKQFGTVNQTERGITLVLPENIWKTTREAALAVTADSKLQRLAQILSNNPDYKALIESHTDDGGAADVLQNLTMTRAQTIAEKLKAFGITEDRLEAKGLGATLPIVANSTNANRAKNRRTEITLIVTEAPIANNATN